MTVLSPSPVNQFFDANGVELSGGKLFTYSAGTTTKINVYTDSTGSSAYPNPIILNSRGEPAPSSSGPSGGIWLTPGVSYKFVLSPSTDTDPPTNPIWTVDQISSGANTGTGAQTVADTGTVNALAVTLTPVPGSYALGLQFLVQVANTSSGPATVNVNGLGAKAITVAGAALAAGALQSGQLYWLVYDGTSFELASLPGPGGWVINADLAPMAAGTVKGNTTGATATPSDIPLTSITAGFQSGMVVAFAMSALPTGWLACQGQAISRATYASLFAAIGTIYGVGDGSTTFNLPNLQGYFLRGVNTSGTGVDPSRGFGSVQTDTFKAHNHYNGVAVTNGSPFPFIYATTTADVPGTSGSTAHTDANTAQSQGSTSTADGTHTTAGTATETRPANVAMLYAIKT